MPMTSSSKKERPLLKTTSKTDFDALWRGALKTGECPFGGCDLTRKTCKHLDSYLTFGRTTFEPRVRLHFVDRDWIEKQSATLVPKPSLWEFFKGLRKYGLGNEQTLLLIYRFGLGMTLRQIHTACGWTSSRTLDRYYAEALRLLRKRGYRVEEA